MKASKLLRHPKHFGFHPYGVEVVLDETWQVSAYEILYAQESIQRAYQEKGCALDRLQASAGSRNMVSDVAQKIVWRIP